MADITVDLWQDFDFTTLDTTNLAANDHATGGTWTITDPNARLSTSTSAEKISTGLIGGNSDSGGTRGLRYDSPADFNDGFVNYEFATAHTDVSFGFWFKFPAEYVGMFDGGQPDLLYVANVLGQNELYVKLTDNNQGQIVLFNPDGGGGATPINVEPDTWYWITAVYGATHRLRVYDDTGALVGAERTVPGASGANLEADNASLGNLIGDEGGGGPFDFDDWVMDWTDATFPLGPPLASGTVEQEGFAFGDDDGNESSHTLDTQDTNATVEVAAVKTLRVLLNGTDDPSSVAYTLRAQKNGSGGYTAVAVGASTKPTPVIETADATESGSNTASGSWAVSYPNASAGDLLIFCISWDDSTTTTDVTEPAGPNSEVLSEVNATPATEGTTAIRCKVWYTIATGSWSASTLTFTPSASEQWTACVVKVPAGEFDATPIGASDTEGGSSTDVQHGAFTAGASDGGGKLCVWTAVDVNPQTVANGFTQVANTDRGAVSGGFFTRDTAVSNSESFSATTAATITSEQWATVAFVVRAPTVTNELYITASANIAAGGEATTARLTAPSGKTTGDFVTGRRWDDENGSDSIDITTDDYTEVEWALTTQSPAQNDDFWDFRVYAGTAALDTYTVTPRLTLGTAGVTGSGTPAAQSATVAGTAERSLTGSGTPSAQAATAAGTAERSVTGSGTPAAQAATVAGSGTASSEVTGSGTPTAQAAVVAGTAERSVTGSGTPTAQSATTAGTAERSVTGAGTPTAQAATVAGSGQVGSDIVGSGTPTAQAATVAGTAERAIEDQGSPVELVAQSATVAGTGAVGSVITGSGAPSAQAATVAGTAERSVVGAGTPAAQPATVTGTGQAGSVVGGSGTPTAQSATVSGTAERTLTGSGTPTSQAASVSGSGDVSGVLSASGALSAQSATVAGTALRVITGSGAPSAQAATVSGTQFPPVPSDGRAYRRRRGNREMKVQRSNRGLKVI